ncbi:hypothetical protein [Rhodoplanes sp. SY1]|uniref:hypothetical protein n=1 Tax=Rhodoplanes sp. SY1 TaxID=3166646 RepID=UPI0038B57CFB
MRKFASDYDIDSSTEYVESERGFRQDVDLRLDALEQKSASIDTAAREVVDRAVLFVEQQVVPVATQILALLHEIQDTGISASLVAETEDREFLTETRRGAIVAAALAAVLADLEPTAFGRARLKDADDVAARAALHAVSSLGQALGAGYTLEASHDAGTKSSGTFTPDPLARQHPACRQQRRPCDRAAERHLLDGDRVHQRRVGRRPDVERVHQDDRDLLDHQRRAPHPLRDPDRERQPSAHHRALLMFPFPIVAPARVTPDAFSFASNVNVGKATLVYSATITPAGYDTAVFASADNGAEISIAGGAWSSVPQLISPGQTIRVRMTSSASWSTAKTTTVSIGGRTATWTVTTGAVTSGAWDTGWTAGGWTFTTPAAFDWLRFQGWAPGGGGGGSGAIGTDGQDGAAGAAGGIVQFAGGPYATGGGPGTGGQAQTYLTGPNASGYTTYHGSGYGGDTNTYAGGASGGGGGPPKTDGPWASGAGGQGGAGGYVAKTYLWGQISASADYSVLLQGRGAGGAGGYSPYGSPGNGGASGGYGRCYIDWG